MLAQFALLAFAFFAVLSVVIDIGWARVTQAQMQNAADTAALEGLRSRDAVAGNAYASDCVRRANANRVVRRVFDDDLDPTNGDVDYQFGAGPVMAHDGGVTNLHALEMISVPAEHVYKPFPQLNQRNLVHGDMVSGRFCYGADPGLPEGLAYADPASTVCTEPQRGELGYARNDFNPNATSPQPPASLPTCPGADDEAPSPWPPSPGPALAGVDDTAFLVRLRRSNELQQFDAQTEPDVASSGPPLPLVFGRATTIYGDDPEGGYSPRRDGLTVRATAIASVRPATHLGRPQVTPPTPNMAPLALRDTCAQTATALSVTVNPATGVISYASGGAAGCQAASEVGRFVSTPANANATAPRSIGPTIGATAIAVSCSSVSGFTGAYAPVYSTLRSAPGTNRIIGFARITLVRGTCPASASAVFPATITRAAPGVAPSNATAILTGTVMQPLAAVPQAQVAEVLCKNHFPTAAQSASYPAAACAATCGNGGCVNYGPVLAPVLAR